jgi:geranylgeranyl transferase type-1 subunit beta
LGDIDENCSNAGFMGGTHEGYKFGEKSRKVNKHHCANIIVTFYCMCALKTLGDDFSRINKKALLTAIKALQQKDGSFYGSPQELTPDMRFSYCAIAVCAFLNDFSVIDIEKATQWILSCQTYEGGFGQEPGTEAHCKMNKYS